MCCFLAALMLDTGRSVAVIPAEKSLAFYQSINGSAQAKLRHADVAHADDARATQCRIEL
jgi:hypothetical protein